MKKTGRQHRADALFFARAGTLPRWNTLADNDEHHRN
jgi:hypothetical protein